MQDLFDDIWTSKSVYLRLDGILFLGDLKTAPSPVATVTLNIRSFTPALNGPPSIGGVILKEGAAAMLTEFWRVAGISPVPNKHLLPHRWGYAIPVQPSTERCFADDSAVVIRCGDWACGSRVEGAFLSGIAAAGRILGTLMPAPADVPMQTELFS